MSNSIVNRKGFINIWNIWNFIEIVESWKNFNIKNKLQNIVNYKKEIKKLQSKIDSL